MPIEPDINTWDWHIGRLELGYYMSQTAISPFGLSTWQAYARCSVMAYCNASSKSTLAIRHESALAQVYVTDLGASYLVLTGIAPGFPEKENAQSPTSASILMLGTQ